MRFSVLGVTGVIGGAIAKSFESEGHQRIAWPEQTDVMIDATGSVSDSMQVMSKTVFRIGGTCEHHVACGGTVVCFSGGGIGGPNPDRDHEEYTASKAALVTYVECVAPRLLRDHDICIYAVAPGQVASRMSGFRGGTPERAVKLVRWLCTPEARHLTGRLIAVRDDIERLRKPVGPDDYRLRRVVPA
jgi:NAD(P)-dependent dehydrogenase (short-subunit alcohol dehydrogenase family)